MRHVALETPSPRDREEHVLEAIYHCYFVTPIDLIVIASLSSCLLTVEENVSWVVHEVKPPKSPGKRNRRAGAERIHHLDDREIADVWTRP
jgi:hypothetical protein